MHWAGKQQFANRFCAVNQVLPIYLHIRYLCQPPVMKALDGIYHPRNPS
jgi:hypothetical protein